MKFYKKSIKIVKSFDQKNLKNLCRAFWLKIRYFGKKVEKLKKQNKNKT